MPKHEIDYSNTIIYKITCKDSMVSDLYVGHTTNFVKRKNRHKYICNCIHHEAHSRKLYQMIRDNRYHYRVFVSLSVLNFHHYFYIE